MIRYRLWVWVLCLIFPTWVWAENTTRTCTSFTQQGRQVTFHLADSAALQLQLCSSSVVKIWFSPDGQLQRRNTSFAVINEELEEELFMWMNRRPVTRYLLRSCVSG